MKKLDLSPNNFRSEIFDFRARRIQKLRKISGYFEEFLKSRSRKSEIAAERLLGDRSATKRGVATLPTVLVLGVMALAVAVGITAVSLTESFISQGSAQSSRALFYAEAGARDALIKIARNKNYTCSSADCYTIDFSTNGCSLLNDCAKVSVSAGVGTAGDPKIVTSKGIMKASARTMQASVVLDTSGYGEITSTTWSELIN